MRPPQGRRPRLGVLAKAALTGLMILGIVLLLLVSVWVGAQVYEWLVHQGSPHVPGD